MQIIVKDICVVRGVEDGETMGSMVVLVWGGWMLNVQRVTLLVRVI